MSLRISHVGGYGVTVWDGNYYLATFYGKANRHGDVPEARKHAEIFVKAMNSVDDVTEPKLERKRFSKLQRKRFGKLKRKRFKDNG